MAKGRWISCSVRLPKKSGTYIVRGVWSSGKTDEGDCEFSTADGYFRTAWNFTVTDWLYRHWPLKEL